MMRRYPVLVMVGLWLGAAGLGVFAEEPVKTDDALPATPTGPAPHIVFDSVMLNLGDVVHGQDAAATFTFHNTGDAPLHILSAKPG
jgi:hypothetical protein